MGVRAERETAFAGIGLGGILSNDCLNFVPALLFYYGGFDVKPPVFEVDRRPTQPQNFRTAQAIKACQKDRDCDGFILRKRQ